MDGCAGRVRTRRGLRSHFARRHWNDTVQMPEEGGGDVPQVSLMRFPVQPQYTNACTPGIARVKGGERPEATSTVLREIRAAMEEVFTLNGIPLERVRSFKYLGRILTDTNSDWPSLYHNLLKARRRWALVSRILEKEGASVRARGMFYKSIVQSILLFGSETWTVTGALLKVLNSFHHRIARRITGKLARRSPDGEWVYPPLQEALRRLDYTPCRNTSDAASAPWNSTLLFDPSIHCAGRRLPALAHPNFSDGGTRTIRPPQR